LNPKQGRPSFSELQGRRNALHPKSFCTASTPFACTIRTLSRTATQTLCNQRLDTETFATKATKWRPEASEETQPEIQTAIALTTHSLHFPNPLTLVSLATAPFPDPKTTLPPQVVQEFFQALDGLRL
jgi:hypothetical protein